MPVIRISDATFANLKSISTWMGDEKPSETIDNLVREKMGEIDIVDESEAAMSAEKTENDDVLSGFNETPSVTHTRILETFVDGNRYTKINWNRLLLTAIEVIKDKGIKGRDLTDELQILTREGQYNDHGYTYYRDLGISVQGQSSNDAWQEVRRLAEKFRFPVKVKFQWREKKGAQYPGRVGVIKAGS